MSEPRRLSPLSSGSGAGPSRLARNAASVLGLALVLCGSSPALRAEVGVVLGVGGPPSSYILQSIVDDPEPVGIAWQQFGSQSPTRHILNSEGQLNGDGRPSIAVAPGSHLPIVAWSRNSTQGYDVVISRFTGEAWLAPVVVAGTAANEVDPFLVVDPTSGEIHLVYWIADATPRVMYRHVSPDLSSLSAAVSVSQPGEIALRPSAVLHEGTLRIAYEVHDYGYGATPRRIVLAAEIPGGYAMEDLAITHFSGPAWPQVHALGSVAWVDWIDAEGEAGWLRKVGFAPWDPTQIESFVGPEEREFHLRGEIRIQATD